MSRRRKIAVGIGAFVIVSPLLLWLALAVPLAIENWRFAREFFDGRVEVAQVLASRKWHPVRLTFPSFGSGPDDCTYAVVEMASDAPSEPPIASESRDFRFAYGSGGWKPTPGPTLWATGDDGLVFCKIRLGDELFEMLAVAMATDGGWWSQSGSIISVYSKPTGLAFRLRQDD